MAKTDLDKNLSALQADAAKQTALYESSTVKLYQNFADAYLSKQARNECAVDHDQDRQAV